MSSSDDETKTNTLKFINDVQTQPSLRAELTEYIKSQNERLDLFSVMDFARHRDDIDNYSYDADYLLQSLISQKIQLDRDPRYSDILIQYNHKDRELNPNYGEKALILLFVNLPRDFIDTFMRRHTRSDPPSRGSRPELDHLTSLRRR